MASSEGVMNLSTMQIIHIAVELVVVAIVTLWLNSKINAVQKENELLKNELAQMRQMIDRQNQTIGNILQAIDPRSAPPKPKSSSKASSKKAKPPSKKSKKKAAPPPVPPSPSSSDDDESEEAFDDEDLDNELNDADDGTLSSADEEVEVSV